MNTFGTKLRLTTFGESHGPAIGGVIDGFPSGFKINFDDLIEKIAERSPGKSSLVSQRQEKDIPEFLSGITDKGITLGSPIGFIIRNIDNKEKDYTELADKYRPNHADFTYESKYGLRDYKGGGRSSARETANWVVAGALAQQWLGLKGISITAFLTGVGKSDFSETVKNLLCNYPGDYNDNIVAEEWRLQMEEEISKIKKEGDSIGGNVTGIITGLKTGMGEPVFDKLQARLASAMMSINAAKGFEYGIGKMASQKKCTEILDLYENKGGVVMTRTNFSGGIQGGISNGMPVFFNVAFKPTPTILKELHTLDSNLGKTCIRMQGRHDPCVALRAVPVVKAMAALVVADFLL